MNKYQLHGHWYAIVLEPFGVHCYKKEETGLQLLET